MATKKKKTKRAPLRATAFRLYKDDFAALDLVKQQQGLSNRAEALRYAIRWWARENLGAKK